MNLLIPPSTDASIKALMVEVYFLSLLFRTRMQEYREYKWWWARGDITIGKTFQGHLYKSEQPYKKNRTSIKICYEKLLAERAREALFLCMNKHVSQQTHTHNRLLFFPVLLTCFPHLIFAVSQQFKDVHLQLASDGAVTAPVDAVFGQRDSQTLSSAALHRVIKDGSWGKWKKPLCCETERKSPKIKHIYSHW